MTRDPTSCKFGCAGVLADGTRVVFDVAPERRDVTRATAKRIAAARNARVRTWFQAVHAVW